MRRTTTSIRRRWGALALAAGLTAGLLPLTGAAAANTVTVYYQPPSVWGSSVDIHYGVDGAAWTPVPGVAMDTACTGWRRRTIDLGAATGLQVVFTNGTGVWDNNNGANYRLGTGPVTVAAGKIGSGDPCATATPSPTASPSPSGSPSTTTPPSPTGSPSTTAGPGSTAEVFYHLTPRGWSAANLHYRPTGGAWTTAPGVAMTVACAGWARRVVDLGTAGGLTAAFNDNAGSWDNNNGADYTLGAGRSTVDGGRITANAADPCTPVGPDTTPPSAPGGLSARADGLAVTLTWSAATDDRGVSGYELTRTGGAAGSTTVTSTTTSYVAYDLSPDTAYTWTVRAVDAAGNRSTASAPATARTSTAPAGGSPLGGDPREDSIYFVMTARFADGDPGNDRGGSQHVASGNAANDDPMFRGDFKGLVDKLDYIKGLGFSAIWITPVVLNRSDYDYHGYHGWDFYRVDPRLESPGASYQDLIDAAHAKGIKIFQDVVYNHSSRWGAKGLFTPTVYGVRDDQWKWYYDQPQAGREYDPMVEATGNDPALTPAQNARAKGRPYDGDLWSSAAPTGNRCLNWGTPTGARSAEGYTIYNCQWPTPTSKLFPADLYHQCWIGNWEGEDARSCWLHEDLADFNTENATVQQYLINAYNRYIDMGVDGFRIDTAVHIPRVTWNRRFLPAIRQHAVSKFGAKGRDFYVFGEVAAFVNDKWNRGSVNHSAQFYTWAERKEYSPDDVRAAIEQYDYEQLLGPNGQPTTDNAVLRGNDYHAPDHSKASGMNVIDMRMHMNFGDATNAFFNGKDSDDSYNDATYNAVYVDSHDYGPNKSATRYAGGTDAWAENMSLMWTFRGIPTLYYGSEIEFQKGARIDCGPTCPLATTGRAYYGDHLAGSVTATDFGVVGSASGAVAGTLDQPLVKHVQRLNRIRRAVPALQKGQYSTEGVSGNTLAFKRRWTGGGVDSFALVSISGGATFTGVPNGTYTDAVTGDVRVVGDGTLTATATGKGNLRVYVLSLPGNPAPGKVGADGPYLR